MLSKEYLATLYAYDAWATTRLLDTAARLDDQALRAPCLEGLGSVHAVLTHITGAYALWRRRLQGESPATMLDPSDLPTLAALRARWEHESAALRQLVEGLDAALLAEPLAYRTTHGAEYSTPRWQILAHLVNHSTQHRSEAAAMLTAFGHSPGDLDMITFFRAQPS